MGKENPTPILSCTKLVDLFGGHCTWKDMRTDVLTQTFLLHFTSGDAPHRHRVTNSRMFHHHVGMSEAWECPTQGVFFWQFLFGTLANQHVWASDRLGIRMPSYAIWYPRTSNHKTFHSQWCSWILTARPIFSSHWVTWVTFPFCRRAGLEPSTVHERQLPLAPPSRSKANQGLEDTNHDRINWPNPQQILEILESQGLIVWSIRRCRYNKLEHVKKTPNSTART